MAMSLALDMDKNKSSSFLPRCRSRARIRGRWTRSSPKVIDAGRSGLGKYVRLCRTMWAKRIVWPGKNRASDEARCRPHLPVCFGSRTNEGLQLKLEASESEVEASELELEASELELEACGPVT